MNNRDNIIPSYSLRQLIGYFLKPGSLAFGGPVALTGYMYRDLVKKYTRAPINQTYEQNAISQKRASYW
jgi:chromate transport protein ChrA